MDFLAASLDLLFDSTSSDEEEESPPRRTRKPTATDVARLYSAHEEKHGFKGMLGSIECMHWAWKNCPAGWKGQYTRGDHGHPTIMLTICGYGIRFLGWLGYSTPIDEPRVKFTRFQANARKDVERTFGVLQGRFAILKTLARVMSVNKMRRIMYSCIVMYNMIQEDNDFALSTLEQEWFDKPENRLRCNIRRRVKDRRSQEKEIRDRTVHDQLREDLTAHIWDLPPNFRSTN
ncbi:uncharacterized protein [Rutidosis leptorrhynchoides]|uniref:uncharacterized protein n=1 Tax=Rutidosis leptorrhynchoides TaxID=125765 RepID=UPI003A99C327